MKEMENMMRMMQEMCKNMDKMNMPLMMRDMQMPDSEAMDEMCKMMEKGDFKPPRFCQECMDIFKRK